jgi:hypothetical protein
VTASKTVIGTLFILNLPLALAIIKLLQFFEFFNLLNLNYPSNLLVFFKLFQGDIFGFLPNIFQGLGGPDDFTNTCEPSGRMGEEEMSCSFLINSGQFLTLLLLLLLFKVILRVISAVFKLKFDKINALIAEQERLKKK